MSSCVGQGHTPIHVLSQFNTLKPDFLFTPRVFVVCSLFTLLDLKRTNSPNCYSPQTPQMLRHKAGFVIPEFEECESLKTPFHISAIRALLHQTG